MTDKQSDGFFLFAINEDFSISVSIDSWIALSVVAIIAIIAIYKIYTAFRSGKNFEIDSAKLGIGKNSITIKPNETDRQIAYSIWVELSTRKIGIPIDLNDDVVAEVYDSWYSFFGVTRELIKSIPISKVRKDSTGKIIGLSIEVLNEGLRPHLTKWQARFRRWYESEMEGAKGEAPQDVQRRFQQFSELEDDLMEVNRALMLYRGKMYDLLTGK